MKVVWCCLDGHGCWIKNTSFSTCTTCRVKDTAELYAALCSSPAWRHREPRSERCMCLRICQPAWAVTCSLTTSHITVLFFAGSCCFCGSSRTLCWSLWEWWDLTDAGLYVSPWGCSWGVAALWCQRFKLLPSAVLRPLPHLVSSRHLDEYQHLLVSCILGKALSGGTLDLENCFNIEPMKTAQELLLSGWRSH